MASVITSSFLFLSLQEGLAPLNLFVEDEMHRATPGGIGSVKTISNYAPVRKQKRLSEISISFFTIKYFFKPIFWFEKDAYIKMPLLVPRVDFKGTT